MKQHLAGFGVGILFALGLGISGMTQPDKVIAFLDVTGDWDPALAFVMGGALLVYTLAFRLITRRERPILARQFLIPTRRDINPPLLIGAALFGAGWGLGGFCPGPALASLVTGATPVLIFVGAMLGGMLLFKLYDGAQARAAEARLTRQTEDQQTEGGGIAQAHS